MRLNEFLLKSPKLNEIPKPGIKSQLKMSPQGRQMYYEKNNNEICCYDNVNLSNKKILHFCLMKL